MRDKATGGEPTQGTSGTRVTVVGPTLSAISFPQFPFVHFQFGARSYLNFPTDHILQRADERDQVGLIGRGESFEIGDHLGGLSAMKFNGVGEVRRSAIM